jgi:hypothetical protein
VLDLGDAGDHEKRIAASFRQPLWVSDQSLGGWVPMISRFGRIAAQPEPAPESFGPVPGVPLAFGSVGAVSAFSFSVGHD